ncbi:MAG: polysaccharide biosynthesis tyrosine autokinase [Verrucomicrobiaceae bacterium]|nr:MAG: polysaccharide biosynthesis tyrosine autokinase [Verrucomicrobiaceae bacterium]
MNPLHYLYLFLRYSWLIILIVAIMMGGTWAWLSKQSPVYASRAVLQVDMDEGNLVNIEGLDSTPIKGTDQLNTVVQSLTSNKVLLAVANHTNYGKEIAQSQKSNGQAGTDIDSVIVDTLNSKLKVTLRRNTRLIDIVAEENSPKKAQALANEVVNQFFLLQGSDKSGVSKDAFVALKAQEEDLRKKMAESDNALADYRQQHKAVSLDEKSNVLADRVKDLNNQVGTATNQRTAIESDLAALKQIPTENVEELLKLNSLSALPDVLRARTAVMEKEAAFATVLERYKSKHPKYGEAQAQLSEAKSKLRTAVANAGDALRQQYRSLTETEEKLTEQLKKAEADALDFDKIAYPYNALKRDAETNRSLHDSIMTRMKEIDITSTLAKSPYKVIEEPLINAAPVRPNPKKIMSIAGLLALLLGSGLVLLMDRLDSSIRTVDEAENILELGVLAAVPDGDSSKIPKGGTVMTDDANSSQAEAYRTLRASLSLLGEESQRRVLLVTSAVPAEGKTFTATNLAAALATQGLSTLLIDADLRRPALSATMLERDVRQNEEFRGLTDVLSGLCTPDEAIRATAVQHLSLMPSGRRAPNPAELLAQGGVEKLIQQLLAKYDRIVFDSAPVNAVSDTLSIAPLANAVCIVLRYGKTPRRAILRAVGLLRKSNARMAGVIMNRMPARRGASYYYYYYGDPYVKDGVYGSSVNPKKKRGKKANDEDAAWPESTPAVSPSQASRAKE